MASLFDDDDDIFSFAKKKDISSSSDSKIEKSYELFYVTTIQLYRCRNNKYEDIGLSGVAILYERNSINFLLHCYKTKDSSIFTLKITKDFPLKYQEDNGNLFAEITQKEQWSLRFPTISMADQFALYMAYAIFSMGDRNALLCHDYLIGSGNEEMQNGDTLGIWWNCYTLDNSGGNFKLVEHSSNRGSRILKRYTIGQPHTTWEKGTIGMRKNGRRIIIYHENIKNGVFLYMVEVERTKRSNRKNQTSNKISQKPEPAKEEIPLPIPTLKEEAHIIELTEETTTKLNPDPFEKILLLNQTLMETIKTELSSKSPVIQNLTQTLQKTQTDLENTTLELTNEKQQNIALKTKISQLETSQTELLEQCQVLNTSLSRVKEELQTFQSKTEEQAQLITNLTQKEEEYKRQVHPPINQMELSQLENLAKKYVEKLNEIHLAISLQKKNRRRSQTMYNMLFSGKTLCLCALWTSRLL